MVKLGEVKLGRQINKKPTSTKFIWAACVDCGKERWVAVLAKKPAHLQCGSCVLKGQIGDDAHNWKGGIISRRGYNAVHMPKHYRATKQGYVMEHLLVWERVHQRRLPKGYLIHHLNGIKTDNRPQNLIAMKKGEHINQTSPYKKRVRELEAEVNILQKALEDNQMIFRIGEN